MTMKPRKTKRGKKTSFLPDANVRLNEFLLTYDSIEMNWICSIKFIFTKHSTTNKIDQLDYNLILFEEKVVSKIENPFVNRRKKTTINIIAKRNIKIVFFSQGIV